MSLQVSVVVPVFNEVENVAALVGAVREALGADSSWELVIVDDGSDDGTLEAILAEGERDPRVRAVVLARNYGQSVAMQAGFDHAVGEVVVTMDGDLQNDPRDIPTLLEKVAEGYDLVVGYRVGRRDPFLTRKVPSWIANRIAGWLTGLHTRDRGCTLKAFTSDLLRSFRLYSDFHRFIPELAASRFGARIAEVPVRHRARMFGTSKYGLGRTFAVLADLLTIKMISYFRIRPLAVFQLGAVVAGLVAAAFVAPAIVIHLSGHHMAAQSMVLPSVALTWGSLSAWLLLLALVGDVVLRRSHRELVSHRLRPRWRRGS